MPARDAERLGDGGGGRAGLPEGDEAGFLGGGHNMNSLISIGPMRASVPLR